MVLLLVLVAAIVVMHAMFLGGMRDITVLTTATAVGLTPLVSVRLTSSVTLGDALLVVAIALAALVPSPLAAQPNPHLKRVLAAVLVMILGGALGMLAVQIQPADTLANAIAYVAATLVPIVLVAVLRPNWSELRVIMAGYGVGVLISVAYATTQDASIYRPTGLTPTSNHLGLTCLFGAVVWIALTIPVRRHAPANPPPAASVDSSARVAAQTRLRPPTTSAASASTPSSDQAGVTHCRATTSTCRQSRSPACWARPRSHCCSTRPSGGC